MDGDADAPWVSRSEWNNPWKFTVLIVADVLSLVAVLWLLSAFRWLGSATRRRPFPKQLAMLALADFVMILGAIWQDWVEFGPFQMDHHVGHSMCMSAEVVLSFGRIVSILTEMMMSLTVVCSALRHVKAYRPVSAQWPLWLVGGALTALDLMSADFVVTPSGDSFCVLEDTRWVTTAVVVLGFLVVTTSYSYLAATALCTTKQHFARTMLRTLIYPGSFMCTFGLLIFFGSTALKNSPSTESVIARAAERMNGFVNVLTYSFALLYCRLCLRTSSNRLVRWPRGSWEAAVAALPQHNSLESVVLAHICYFENISSCPDPGPAAQSGVSLTTLLREGPRESMPPSLAPSINAFSVRRCRLVLEPPTLEHLFLPQTVLGQGAFGQVSLMLATANYGHIRGGEQYAIKCILSSTMEHESQPFRYVWQERDAMVRASNHPGVVRLFESFVLASSELAWILVMEYCPGGTLQDRVDDLEGDGLPLASGRRWAAQTLEALRFLHAVPILHRDLKPANVLLASGEVCKLADFGVAVENATARSIQGTLGYMAPEMIMSTRPYTAAADIFSWGKMVLCLLVGLPYASTFHAGGTTVEAVADAGGPPSAADLVDLATAEVPGRRPDAAALKRHAFFEDVDWDTVYRPVST